MSEPVNRRRYVAPRREEAAALTRERILAAAAELFARQGWDRTPVVEIARAAGVSVDTVYSAVGPKPVLIRLVVDAVLGEGRGPVPAEQRAYVGAIQAARTAEGKVGTYAQALGRLMPKVAPLLLALREAGTTDPACEQVWRELTERRADNMRRFAADLRATGQIRDDLADDVVADVVWATNSPEYFAALASRGWPIERYVEHLSDLWSRLLIDRRGI